MGKRLGMAIVSLVTALEANGALAQEVARAPRRAWLPSAGCEAPATAPPAGSIQSGFTPNAGSDAGRLVLQVIATARKDLRVSAYAMTSGAIQNALQRAARCGVTVRLILDYNEGARLERNGRLRELAANGVEVRLSEPGLTMHDKIMIADGHTVQTGSFNYTMAAERRNVENVIVIWGNFQVADQYIKHFEDVWQATAPL